MQISIALLIQRICSTSGDGKTVAGVVVAVVSGDKGAMIMMQASTSAALISNGKL